MTEDARPDHSLPSPADPERGRGYFSEGQERYIRLIIREEIAAALATARGQPHVLDPEHQRDTAPAGQGPPQRPAFTGSD